MEKRKKIIYWVATALLSFGMLGSGIQQILQTEPMLQLIAHVHFPSYFLYILGTWKILAVVAILLPKFKLVKEWAYAGLFFAMSGAFFSHLALQDDFRELIGPFMQCVFIVTSWYYRPADRKLVQQTGF